MFDWLTQRRRMVGGLYFGPAAWSPERVETEAGAEKSPSPAADKLAGEQPPPTVPEGREAFTAFLAALGLERASATTPGLHEQMQEIGQRHIRAVVLNLLPTQPEYALSAALSREGMREMIAGLGAIQRAIRARRVLVIVDRHDWRTRRLWRRAKQLLAKNSRANSGKSDGTSRWTFETKRLLNQYPVSHPTILMRRIFGKRLAVGRLPVRVNRILVDPVTCWALGRWLATGASFSSRPVQIFRAAGKESSARLVMATIGETIQAFCARWGVKTGAAGAAGIQVIVNGMLAGEEVDPAVARVETWTESVSVREMPLAQAATPCFACGWCVDVCPTGLNPVSLMKLAEDAARSLASAEPGISAALTAPAALSEARESLHCIGCGLCSYVCPTRLPLTQRTLELRARLAERPGRSTGPALHRPNPAAPENLT